MKTLSDHEIIVWTVEHLTTLLVDVNDNITFSYVDNDGYDQTHCESKHVDEDHTSVELLKRAVTKLAKPSKAKK